MPLALLIAHVVVVTIVIADVMRRPEATWARARENRLLWLTAMVVLPVVGMAGYWFVARPRLRRAAARP
ncbi:MAG: PLDc N-terminal domain-containing protein [Actinobacteria bacterium]|nr:PLDc N-terminal domain-containing protein [Actinomycetota bacterium]